MLAGFFSALCQPCGFTQGVVAWCDVPGIGEASNPGPGANFDDDQPDDADDLDIEPWRSDPGEMDWAPEDCDGSSASNTSREKA